MTRIIQTNLPLLLWFVAASPAGAQTLAGGASPDISFVRIAFALIICVVAAFFAIIWLHRHGATSPHADWLASFATSLRKQPRIRVIETRKISSHADMCLAECDTTQYLLLCTAAGATVLATSPVPMVDAGEASGERP